MVVGVNPVIQEVEAIAAPTVTTITLRSAWTGTGGTYSFLANQTSEGLRDAVQAIRSNNASLQSFIDSIDTAATADSVAQRTSDGSLNAVDVNATRLLTTGDAGIGTSSPTNLGGSITTLEIKGKANDRSGGIYLTTLNASQSSYMLMASGLLTFGTETNNPVSIISNGAERMRIDSSGNVGINTNSPAEKLHIRTGSTYAATFNTTQGVSSETRISIGGFSNDSGGGNGSVSIGALHNHSANALSSMVFYNNGTTECMRIDSDGALLVGTTTANVYNGTTTGVAITNSGYIFAGKANDAPMWLNRIGSDGAIAYFQKDGTTVGSIGTFGGAAYVANGNTGLSYFNSVNAVYPCGSTGAGRDNAISLGLSANRFSVVYAATGSINTSDAREKTPVDEFTADELNAAKQLSKEIGTYQFLSAVAKKGDAARKHVGMTVQRAIEIMEANNLDPFAYGFICYDKWEEQTVDHPAVEAVEGKGAWTETIEHEAELDENGEVIKEAWAEVIEHEAVEAVEAKDAYTEVVQEAGDRYSFRPDEMLFFIARGLEARIEALEG
jgi:hypothetical protein